MRSELQFSILFAVLACARYSPAGDWPQILGPNRDGIAQRETLADRWPAGGPRTLWQRPVGDGFAGAAIVSDRAVVWHRQGDEHIVESLNLVSGDLHWKKSLPAKYVPSYTRDSGPRVVPLINGDRVFLFCPRGDLYCLAVKNGETIWHRDTWEDYSSKRPKRGDPPDGYFGFGTSPILEGDRLLLNVGGDSKSAGLVAFDAGSGKTLWTATEERASYSSPVAATIGGQRQIIFATRLSVLSVDPTNGHVLFQFPFGQFGPAVTAANPVVIGDRVFITASYNFGATLAQVGGSGAVRIWESDEILSSQYTTPILHGGALFGIHGRQDAGAAALRCIDPATKRVLWNVDGFGYASLLMADGKLIILKTDGELVLARADKSKFVELSRTRLFSDTTRALPALSNGRLLVRDTSTLKCVNLK
ncbi:PQQ-binding-like beta-propeller repeat protein [bacterium]|nr:PQQ-binding-like beta-propeller repeat protein [bacterium]